MISFGFHQCHVCDAIIGDIDFDRLVEINAAYPCPGCGGQIEDIKPMDPTDIPHKDEWPDFAHFHTSDIEEMSDPQHSVRTRIEYLERELADYIRLYRAARRGLREVSRCTAAQ